MQAGYCVFDVEMIELYHKEQKIIHMKEKGKMNEIKLRPTYWASVSGGKDSLYMLNLILHNLNKYPLDGVVHFELEIDYPFIKNVIDYMEKECKKHNINFIRIKPRKSWYDLYEKYGMPTRKARWCNEKYKLDALKQLKEFMKLQGAYVVSYIGYCADEVKRYEKRNFNEIYPLVDFNILESDVLEWAKTVPLFNNYYITQHRCGCMFCPLTSRLNLAYLLKYYPKKYEELIYLSSETEKKREKELKRPFSVWASNPKYNTNYIDKNVRNKWLPKLEHLEKSREIKKLLTQRQYGEKRGKNMSEAIETETIELNKELAEKFINKYTLAVENGKKYAWKMVEVIYTTVNHKDFNKAFSSQREYAKAIGFSEAKISKAISCYEKHLYLIENEMPAFSVGQIEETAKIEIDEMPEFVNDTKVNELTTIKDMRKAVKDWLHRNDTTEEAEAEETTGEEINETPICVYEFDGFHFESTQVEVAEKIKKFIEENFMDK